MIYASLIHDGLVIAVEQPIAESDVAVRLGDRLLPITLGVPQRIPDGLQYFARFNGGLNGAEGETLDVHVRAAHSRNFIPVDGLFGHIERITDGEGFGWVIEITAGARSHRAAVVTLDGRELPVAFVERTDIEAIAPNGRGSALVFALPDWVEDGQEHAVELRSPEHLLHALTHVEAAASDDATIVLGAATDDTLSGRIELRRTGGRQGRFHLRLGELELGRLPMPELPDGAGPQFTLPVSIDVGALRLLAAMAAPTTLSLHVRAGGTRATSSTQAAGTQTTSTWTMQPAAEPGRKLILLRSVAQKELLDIACCGTHGLSLRLAAPAGDVGAFQLLPEGLRACEVHVGNSAGGQHVATVTLIVPYAPLLLCLRGGFGTIRYLDLLPFPSLCRGGLHGAELRAVGGPGSDLDRLGRLSGSLLAGLLGRRCRAPMIIATHAAEAAGGEPILSRDMSEWLQLRMNARLVLATTPEEAEKADLVIGPNSVPSLSALAATTDPDAPLRPVSFAQAPAPGDTGPIWQATIPPLGKWFERLQFGPVRAWYPRMRLAPAAGEGGRCGLAGIAAIETRQPRPPHVNDALFPAGAAVAPSPFTGEVTACIALRADGDEPMLLLESLALQAGIGTLRVVVATAGQPAAATAGALERLFPGRHATVVAHADTPRMRLFELATCQAGGGIIVLAAPGVVLHDPQTLARLAEAAALPEACTVGCTLISGSGGQLDLVAEGYELYTMAMSGYPAVAYRPATHGLAPSGATTAVLANPAQLLAVRADRLAGLGGLDGEGWGDAADVALGLLGIAAGLVNLCMTSVSAFADSPPRGGNLDIDLLHASPAWNWAGFQRPWWPGVSSPDADLCRRSVGGVPRFRRRPHPL